MLAELGVPMPDAAGARAPPAVHNHAWPARARPMAVPPQLAKEPPWTGYSERRPCPTPERRGAGAPCLDMLGAITGLESTYLTSIDLQAGIQHALCARNEGGMQIPEGMDVPWADTLCKRALDEGAPAPAMSRAAGRTPRPRASSASRLCRARRCAPTTARCWARCAAPAPASRPSRRRLPRPCSLFSAMLANFMERELLVEQLRSANVRLLSYALISLTGLPNRRAIYEELERLQARAARGRQHPGRRDRSGRFQVHQ